MRFETALNKHTLTLSRRNHTFGVVAELVNLLKIKIMALYYQNKDGEQFKLDVKTSDNNLVDKLLDQLNLLKESQTISESEFNTDLELMEVDVMDDENPNVLIAVLTTKKIQGV